MFLEDKKTKIKDSAKVFGERETVADPNSNIFVIIALVVFMFLFFFSVRAMFFSGPKLPTSELPETGAKNSTATSARQFPLIPETEDDEKYRLGTSSDALIAENVGFGYFYNAPEDNFDYRPKNYELPLNVKTDVNNFYAVSRVVNLDNQVEDLNRYGFSIIEKQNVFSQKDFFAAYRSLHENNVPMMLTGDFLIYYYLNTLKGIYKEIEKNVFYERIWNMNKAMYDISLARYKKTYSELGPVNDLTLEGQRLQLAYFTVILRLLMPEENQVIADANFSDANKFNLQEADKYSFVMPDFMKVDIEKEVELIREANKTAKSPVFLYEIDYSKFSVPPNYKNNAKLNNYYLAINWLKSVFPLYNLDESCSDCLLDRNDWNINLYAACSISRDLFDNQDLKNQWAIVYKFISFFTGLRQDLTYLNYHEALSDVFGEDYSIENIFSVDNPNHLDDISRIRERIGEFSFSAIEGSLDRANPENRSEIGMRILQSSYWPNDYLFGRLTGDDIVYAEDEIKKTPKTFCYNKEGVPYRCLGIGMDIVNLVYPVRSEYSSAYFIENTNYNNYRETVAEIRNEMLGFNEYTRNNNIYWLTLDILKPLLAYQKTSKSVYFNSPKWMIEREFNSAQGVWVNLHTAEDILEIYSGNTGNRVLGGSANSCNKYNYIEPKPELISDLIARNTMMIKMLSVLKVTEDTNSASLALKDFNDKLESILSIIKKELNNESLDENDCMIIRDIASRYFVKNEANKSYELTLNNKKNTYSIRGVNLLALIYKTGEENALVFGPVFNYSE